MSRAPYKYLDYYNFDDADLFFGREAETQKMVGEILSTRLLVLFSPSGSGKTSLINAGVRPALEKLGYETVYVRLDKDPIPSVQSAVVEAVALSASTSDFATSDLHGFLKNVTSKTEKPLVIFVDQFEEFFIVFENQPQLRQQFIEQVAKIKYDDQLPVFLVLSLREDYFANLHEFREAIPSIFQNNANIRLEPFTEAEARKAIEEPAKVVGCEYEAGLAERMLQDLKNGRPGIEPITLQIVCNAVWEEKAVQAQRLTFADYEAAGGADHILRNYVSCYLDNLSARQQSLMAKIFAALKTPDDTKRYRTFEDLQATLKLNPSRLKRGLDQLVAFNLLRQEPRAGTNWYEFKHDYLVGEITDWLQQRKERINRHRLIIYGASPIIAIFLGLSGYFIYQYNTFYAGFVNPEYPELQEEIAIFRVSGPFSHSRSFGGMITTGLLREDVRNYEAANELKEKFKLGFLKKNDWKQLSDKLKSVSGGKFLYQLGEEKAGLDSLLSALKNSDYDVRSQAAAALVKLGPTAPAVIKALLDALKDSEFYVRRQAAAALGEIKSTDPAVIKALLDALKDEDSDVRRQAAAAALSEIKSTDPAIIKALLDALKDLEFDVRRQAAAALGEIKSTDPAVVKALLDALKDQDSDIRRQAAAALGEIKSTGPAVIKALLDAPKDEDSGVRWQAVAALGEIKPTDPAVIKALLDALKDQDSDIRRQAAAALGEIKSTDPTIIKALLDALKDQDSDVRSQAAAALGEIKSTDPAVIKALLDALKDSDLYVRSEAAAALGHLLKTKLAGELLAFLTNNLSGYRTAGARALARQDSLPPALQKRVDQLRQDDRPWARLAAWEAYDLMQARLKSEAEAKQRLHQADSLFARGQWSVASGQYENAFDVLQDIIRVDSAKTAYAKFQQARCEVRLKRIVPALDDLKIAFEYNPTLRDTLRAEIEKPNNDWTILQENWYLREVLQKR